MIQNQYEQITKNIRLAYMLRDDAEEVTKGDNKTEKELALFMGELLHQYSQSVVTMTADSEDSVWYVVNKQAASLAKDLERTMTRLKMCLWEEETEESKPS